MTAPRTLFLEVPGSTSNLGPGFDFLGLCIGLWLRIRARHAQDRAPGAHRVAWSGNPGLDATWDVSDDLLLRAIRAAEKASGGPIPALDLEATSDIPVGRGFGSSGAAVAAGLLTVEAFRLEDGHEPTPEDALLQAALRLEGHPDNATASLLGGCTLGVPHDAGLTVLRQPVHGSLGLAVAWPDDPLYTPAARGALPASVAHADAVENPRRLALLLEGLRTGDPTLLRLGVEDRLHERFRRALIPGSDRACRDAVEAGAFAACLSGAGSGLVAIGPAGAMGPIAEALAAPLAGGEGRPVDAIRVAPVPTWDS